MTIPESTTASSALRGISRRHDLDALRAFAMLLGIVLHVALAFVPGSWWVIEDVRQEDWFGLMVSAIHGFRMPLFFLMSGFFTAMLWRRRGLSMLIQHRLSRVLLPLLIALFTVVPAINCAVGFVERTSEVETVAEKPQDATETNLWKASAEGDSAAVGRYLSEGADLDIADPVFGVIPLSWAAMAGHEDVVDLLLQKGASVDARNRDGSTALHGAMFVGYPNVVRVLMKNGADVNAKNNNGETPLESAVIDLETTAYVLGLIGFSFDADRVAEGRQEAVALIRSGEDISRQEENHPGGTGEIDTESVSQAEREEADFDFILPFYWELVYSDVPTIRFGEEVEQGDEDSGFNLIHTSVFHHLWFLRDLLWLVGFFAIYAYAADRFGWIKVLSGKLVLSLARYLWILPVTFCLQWFMGIEGLVPSFGPDTFPGLLPLPHLLLYYSLFFGFGALYYEHKDDTGEVGKGWWMALPLGVLVIFPLAIDLEFGGFGFADLFETGRWQRFVSVFLQAVYPWLMTFGFMGLFRVVMNKGRYAVRYVSDSSYWLYITHLPLIIMIHYTIREWEFPAILKFALLCAVATAILLLIYQAVVRYTWVGVLLNGPRRRPVGAHFVQPAGE